MARTLAGHYARTVGQMRWNSLRTGILLAPAEAEFDALITMDKGIRYQRSIAERDLCLILLRARSNRFGDVEPLVPQILAALESIQPRTVVIVGELPEAAG